MPPTRRRCLRRPADWRRNRGTRCCKPKGKCNCFHRRERRKAATGPNSDRRRASLGGPSAQPSCARVALREISQPRGRPGVGADAAAGRHRGAIGKIHARGRQRRRCGDLELDERRRLSGGNVAPAGAVVRVVVEGRDLAAGQTSSTPSPCITAAADVAIVPEKMPWPCAASVSVSLSQLAPGSSSPGTLRRCRRGP